MPDKTKIIDVIKDRHEEASEVKRCFTDFAFKGLLLATAFFGVILRFYPTGAKTYMPYFLTWLFCGVVILVLLRILRIGFHKYSTANRNYGYVLHLDRTYDYETADSTKESHIREVGWEGAMFAWRVVQPIIFEEIYKLRTRTERICFPLLRTERRFDNDNGYHWWNTEYLMDFEVKSSCKIKPKSTFRPGSYLARTQQLIHIICAAIYTLFSVSFFIERSCMYDIFSSNFNAEPILVFNILYFSIWGFLTAILAVLIIRQYKRRQILEKGLLSIQSCAVVWRLVVISHLKAVREGVDYKGYTRRLVKNAYIIRDNLFGIHKNIMKDDWPPTENQNDKGTEVDKGKVTQITDGTNSSEGRPGIVEIKNDQSRSKRDPLQSKRDP